MALAQLADRADIVVTGPATTSDTGSLDRTDFSRCLLRGPLLGQSGRDADIVECLALSQMLRESDQ
jgi:hypothetical protein